MNNRFRIVWSFLVWWPFFCFSQNASLVISEVQPSNHVTLADEDGNYEDWLELHNTTAQEFNLDGWSLTDDATNLRKWTMTGGSIPAGGYLVVFASNKDRTISGANLHTNFRLTATGDYLALVNPSGAKVMELNPIPRIDDDFSYGRINGVWIEYSIPTPGVANTMNGLYCFPAPNFNVKHGLFSQPFLLTMSCPVPNATMYYTTDGSLPSKTNGIPYNTALYIAKTTVLRAIAVKDPATTSFLSDSRVTTATYLFPQDIIHQSNSPAGFPEKWGKYASITDTVSSHIIKQDTAIADYEMDPELIGITAFADSVVQSFSRLPIISLVTDKDHFFRRQNDPINGGIYIYTEPKYNSKLDTTIRQWERPVSFEYFNPSSNESLQVDGGIQLHGGASRWAEKSPKHSFRIDFRSDYGVGKLRYPILGKEGPRELNSFFLRAGFSDSWNHWSTSEQKQATYVRDPWAKLTQLRMSDMGTHSTYVHLFINGVYWGVYNPDERIDNDFCETLLGGNKYHYDVLKPEGSISTSGGASDGNTIAWRYMMSQLQTIRSTNIEASTEVYQRMQGLNPDGTPNPVFPAYIDMDNFIDYMLINYYGNNSDWDSHNWMAVRDRVNPGKGFKFFCWDTENILHDVNGNRLYSIKKDNVTQIIDTVPFFNVGMPTQLFHLLDSVPLFRIRLADRIQKHLFNDGWLTPTKAAKTFKDLTGMINSPLYAESARWGDFRRDVLIYSSSKGELYRPDVQYLTQKNTLLNSYFPQRTAKLLTQFKNIGLFPLVNAPVFNINGAAIVSDTINQGDRLTMIGTGELFYTLNQSDPVTWSLDGVGTVNPTAQKYVGALQAEQTIEVKARALYQGEWSAMNVKRFVVRIVTNTREVESSEIALTNYPNPFAVATTVSFTLAERAYVRLSVFDLSGRLIKTLVSEERGIGSHSIEWNASQFSSGMFVCKLDVLGAKPQSKVLRLIKR